MKKNFEVILQLIINNADIDKNILLNQKTLNK